MANVEKELWDLVAQYRSDPNKNINPFSMRLQGIIDANVMGGISKYQEAFFTDQYAKSAEGISQQSNVHKLKCLILDQVQVLETALELHGQLAPVGVQPLHKRLLERFSQLKQSLNGLGKLKRQHSESIVNTPLPPLPIEKRALSLGNQSAGGGNYEQDDIYTRPTDNSIAKTMARDGLTLPEISRDIPPVPIRPRSAGYVSLSESPEIPPKNAKDKNAPPLPPRGYTPDKRASNPISFGDFEQAPNIPRRTHKYSVVNISLDDEVEADHQFQNAPVDGICDACFTPVDFRDSGISTSSNDLNNPRLRCSAEDITMTKGHQKNNSTSESLNIQSQEDLLNSSAAPSFPPPIPPKSNIFMSFDASGSISPILSTEDGYCAPKTFDKKESNSER